jgi:hypothetical protein
MKHCLLPIIALLLALPGCVTPAPTPPKRLYSVTYVRCWSHTSKQGNDQWGCGGFDVEVAEFEACRNSTQKVWEISAYPNPATPCMAQRGWTPLIATEAVMEIPKPRAGVAGGHEWLVRSCPKELPIERCPSTGQ